MNDDATNVQLTGLKALATKVLSKSDPCNNHATKGGLGVQQTPISDPSFVAQDDPLPNAQMEARRQAVLATLRANPNFERVLIVYDKADPDYMILAVGIRHSGTVELRCPREEFDPFKAIELTGKHSGRALVECEPVARPGEPAGLPAGDHEKLTA